MLIMEDLCWVIVHSGGLLEMHIWDAFWTLNCTQVPSMASGDLCGKWYAECKLMQTKSKKNIQNSVQYKCVHINVKYRYYLCIFCKARRIWVSLPASKTIFFFDTKRTSEKLNLIHLCFTGLLQLRLPCFGGQAFSLFCTLVTSLLKITSILGLVRIARQLNVINEMYQVCKTVATSVM